MGKARGGGKGGRTEPGGQATMGLGSFVSRSDVATAVGYVTPGRVVVQRVTAMDALPVYGEEAWPRAAIVARVEDRFPYVSGKVVRSPATGRVSLSDFGSHATLEDAIARMRALARGSTGG